MVAASNHLAECRSSRDTLQASTSAQSEVVEFQAAHELALLGADRGLVPHSKKALSASSSTFEKDLQSHGRRQTRWASLCDTIGCHSTPVRISVCVPVTPRSCTFRSKLIV